MSMFLVALLAGIASIFNFSVGDSGLRISLGIVVVIVALYKYRDLPVISTATMAGVAVVLVRMLASSIGGENLTVNAVWNYSLEFLFYLSYGIFYNFLVRKDTKSRENAPLIILLMLCDFGANAVEYIIRDIAFVGDFAAVNFTTLLVGAFVRSALIWLIISYVVKDNVVYERT